MLPKVIPRTHNVDVLVVFLLYAVVERALDFGDLNLVSFDMTRPSPPLDEPVVRILRLILNPERS
jgi:hypothetical protein